MENLVQDLGVDKYLNYFLIGVICRVIVTRCESASGSPGGIQNQ